MPGRKGGCRGDRKGIEAVADALMYLAIMMLASAAVFSLFPAHGTGDAAEQARLMDGARWTSMALVQCEVGDNGTVSYLLLSGWFDADALSSLMEALVPEGYGWNVTWTSGGAVRMYGEMPTGSVGGHELELGDGRLMIRIFRC